MRGVLGGTVLAALLLILCDCLPASRLDTDLAQTSVERSPRPGPYIEYPSMCETEYYDLKKDPYQLDGEATSPPPELGRHLQALKNCAGAGCRAVDGGP